MTRVMGLVLLVLLGGCVRDYDWETVVSVGPGASWEFQWRGEDELWGFGTGAIRRTDGVWEAFTVCPDGSAAHGARGAFEPDGAMWVICPTEGGGQTSVHYDADADGTLIGLPLDGDLRLVPIGDEVLVMGATQIWAFDGAEFAPIAEHPFGVSVLQVGGTGRDSIYATYMAEDPTYGGRMLVGLMRYDGSVWSPIELPGAEPDDDGVLPPVGPLTWYPDDESWYVSPWRLDGPDAVLDDEWLLTGGWWTRDHELVFNSGGASTVGGSVSLWVIGPGDTRVDEYLGSGAFIADTLYGGGFSDGVIYAISRDEILARISDASHSELLEGRR